MWSYIKKCNHCLRSVFLNMSFAAESIRLMNEVGEIKWCPLEGSKIVDFYKNKNVFVTGATGFLGKLLVEKLLRACPDINTIFILVRPKKGEDEYSRVDKLYADPLFRVLNKISPKFQHKIRIIKGEISKPNLGLSSIDKRIICEQVNVIFHIAATLNFDEKINLATFINVRSTRDLLQIAQKCINLEAFVNCGTAYANCTQEEIDEIFYETPITADELIEMVENSPEDVLIENTQKILGKWPNTYTFTKAISEDVIKNYSKNLPVCLVRPAIVIATYKEPLRGWIDNLNGATGIVIGAGTGILKSIHCDRTKAAEVVPADYVINSMIAASYKTALDRNKNKVTIYNYISSVENRQDWENFMEKCRKWGTELPTIRCIWYYSLTLNRYKFVHQIYSIFLHFLPALVMDFGLILTGKKPIMFKIYKKILKFESVIAHFATNQWKFYNDNTQCLWKGLTESDQKMFPFSMKDLDWEEYHSTHILGVRQYLLKEDLSTLPEATRKWKTFYVADRIIKTIFYLSIVAILYLILSTYF